MIDLVPNHVARTYHSDIKPDLDFGKDDDTSKFFDPQNNFFYLVDPPGQSLQLPNPSHWQRPPGTDGTLEREDNDGTPAGDVPKATGNNQTSPSPTAGDWYETVKLNYGYNFADGSESYQPIPDTWKKVDKVIAYWQNKGVDGFRCDFAHLVPDDAWQWLIQQARRRDPDVYFLAEAFETASAPQGFTLDDLIKAGFDAVYDDPGYDILKGMFCCGKWANDLHDELPGEFMYGEFLRYAENHDERRIASPVVNGQGPDSSGFGSIEAGKPVSGTLYLLGPGPLLVFNGQEVGEPAAGKEGFGGDDGRTTIFDYWTMPQMAKWVNDGKYDGGGLDQKHKDLRAWYAEILKLAQKPGLGTGSTYSLQTFNKDNPDYTKGKDLFSYLRYDTDRDAWWLVVANFGTGSHSFDLTVPEDALQKTGLDQAGGPLTFERVFGGEARTFNRTLTGIRNGGVPLSIGPRGFEVYRIGM
jgi:glycosidase